MIGISFCAILSLFHVVLSDQIPPHCRGPPPTVANPAECCKLQQVFNEEDLKECGIEKPSEDGKPKPMPDCSKQVCLMKRHNLMKDETTVDKDAVAATLDEIVEDNADSKTAVDVIKEQCLKGDLPGPPTICETNKILSCISRNVIMNCPKWEETDNCKILKNHVEQCKKYFT